MESSSKPPQSMRVMISYSTQDSKFVDELIVLLNNYGISPWIDRGGMRPGKKWHGELLNQLRNCDVLITVLSAAFLDSDTCKMEVFIARSGGKRIIPIMYSPDLDYTKLTESPETKGLEDLFMFRILDDGQSQGMALNLERDDALARTCRSVVEEHSIRPNLAYVAFLSTEVEFATELANGLTEKGVDTWIATRDIPVGKNFMQDQIAAMMNAAALIVVLGEGIEESGYIRTELNLAKALGIDVLPVLPERYHKNQPDRNQLMAGLRGRDHTLELYQTHAYSFQGDLVSIVNQITNDLPESTNSANR